MTAAETTWERHEAGLPARDADERARYAELDACSLDSLRRRADDLRRRWDEIRGGMPGSLPGAGRSS